MPANGRRVLIRPLKVNDIGQASHVYINTGNIFFRILRNIGQCVFCYLLFYLLFFTPAMCNLNRGTKLMRKERTVSEGEAVMQVRLTYPPSWHWDPNGDKAASSFLGAKFGGPV